MQFDQFAATAAAISFNRRTAQWQQFLLSVGIEEIQISVVLVKLTDRFLILEVVNAFFVTISHFDQVGRKFAGLGIAFGQISFEISAVPSHCFT